MAPIYERLTDAYSLGCLPRAKRRQLSHFHAGMRVLYVGIGPGSDALAAAEKGAEVTGVDVSARMIELASASFASAGLRADLRHCDLFSFDPDLPYDVVVANFLLDCFHHPDRQRVVERLRCFPRTGGTVLISDTGSPRGSRLGRACWYSYHGVGEAERRERDQTRQNLSNIKMEGSSVRGPLHRRSQQTRRLPAQARRAAMIP
jgi:2-polyprenyl-3-methyl-5-hydroxy-6-metoxy-1,4-benzoquinol methylase